MDALFNIPILGFILQFLVYLIHVIGSGHIAPIIMGLATPITLGALCGVMNERSGVVNIGIEGMMLFSAYVAFMTALVVHEAFPGQQPSAFFGATPALVSGVFAAMAAGVLISLLHAWLSISIRADQIISGTIINIASHAGVYRWPLLSAYAVSKGALIKFSENLAIEVKEHGVSVFAFHPGLLAIGMTEALLAAETQPDSASDQVAEWFRRQIASGRSVPPERGAATVLALASGAYSNLSGCYLTVDDDLDALAARTNGNGVSDLCTLRLLK